MVKDTGGILLSSKVTELFPEGVVIALGPYFIKFPKTAGTVPITFIVPLLPLAIAHPATGPGIKPNPVTSKSVFNPK